MRRWLMLISLAAISAATVSGPMTGAVISNSAVSEREQREVDAQLAKADSVELGKLSPRVLTLANRLLKERGDAVARPYFEQGLKGYAWAFDEQLTYGEILGRSGQPEALKEKAAMVLRLGEEAMVLERAARLLGRPLPTPPLPFAELRAQGKVVALLPVGEVNLFLLEDLREALEKRLGIEVRLAAVKMDIPPAGRTGKQQWVTRTREQLLKKLNEQVALERQLRQMGFSVEDIRTKDESVVSLIRKDAAMSQGPAAAEAFDAMMKDLENDRQWSVDKLLPDLTAAAGGRAGPEVMVLGVTSCDLYGGTSNFLFGAGNIGRYVGLISLQRFSAAFNHEAPKRERLTGRLLKQALSTIGFMIGVPRCTSPDCARAYPKDLAEHDQKPSTLCPACRAGFVKALGRELPEH